MEENPGYRKRDLVVIFAQDERYLKPVMSACDKMRVYVFPTADYIDLIALPCFMIFIESRLFFSLPDSHIENVVEALSYEENSDLKIIFIGDNEAISSRFCKSQYRKLSSLDEKNIELLVLEQHRKYLRIRKKEKSQEKIISRRILLLFEGLKGNPIRKHAMAKEFSVSERTILRDIEFLRGLGELFEYDTSSKAYWLTFSSFKDMFDINHDKTAPDSTEQQSQQEPDSIV